MKLLGLTSVTFRHLSCDEIIRIAKENGLSGIEWGADVHVPPGDVEKARIVRKNTENNGLSVFSYGSYYKTGEQPDIRETFRPVLDTAVALGAPIIRVWAGSQGSAEAAEIDRGQFEASVRDTRIIADMASAQDVTVAFEYHRGTLTDTAESALRLLREVGRENVKAYWQPNPEITVAQNLSELSMVLPCLTNVHVFYWDKNNVRLPLRDGEADWRIYLSAISKKTEAGALIFEFVKDDKAEQLRLDTKAFKRWCEK